MDQGKPNKRKGRNDNAAQASQDLKKEIKRLDSHARNLLKNAGKDIRQVRSEVSRLKKLGIVSERINARSYVPSRYMLTKLRKNADVLRGEMVAVKAPKNVIAQYIEKGLFEKRGKALIIPRESAEQKTQIKRGFVQIIRPLKNGQEERIILPFKATDMEKIAEGLKNDPTFDGRKNSDEMFGFRFNGHNMNPNKAHGFVDTDELIDYIQRNYRHLFMQGVMRTFELVRFKGMEMPDAPEEGKLWTAEPPEKTRRIDWLTDKKRERAAIRQAKRRAKETPEARQTRLDKQRRRSAINRERKWQD